MDNYLEKIDALKKAILAKSKEVEAAFSEKDTVGAQRLLDEIDDLKAQIEDMKQMQTAQLNNRVADLSDWIKRFESEPTLRNSGYITVDGGTKDAGNKSFADFLLAIMRKDDRRLRLVYGAAKDISETSGPTGGYLVPEEFLSPMKQIEATVSPLLAKVTRIRVKGDHGRWPALDQYFAPTAGSGATAMAGRVVSTATATGGTLTETQPQFTELQYTIHKEGGYVEVDNETIADSPQSIDTLLRQLFAVSVAAKKERHILRGSGAGEPLGILTALASSSDGPTIAVTTAADNVFAWADALSMRARFKRISGEPCWVIHPGVWPDIGQFEIGTAGAGAYVANMGAALGAGAPLLGFPVYESEHMPQDDNDDVILADFSAYIMFERDELSIAYSEHAAFTTDKGTWRFTSRFDGKPWLKSAITLADPQGSYTVSPFVFHDD